MTHSIKKISSVFLAAILLFLFSSNGTKAVAPTQVNFYSATRPSQPFAFYPTVDPECVFPPYCLNFFYSPNIIFENGKYLMWTTIDDMVFYFESTDGITWTNGRKVFSALQNNWETDNVCANGVCGGISDPRVVTNVSPGWKYTMYYTAGNAPNTETSGGLGAAVSNDGINWGRYPPNPIFRFPNGGTFAMQALKIEGKLYLYFLGHGNYYAGQQPGVHVVEDLGQGLVFGNDREIAAFGHVDGDPRGLFFPLAYDPVSKSCWLGHTNSQNSSKGGPTEIQIYNGSDCFSTTGTLVATIPSSDIGSVSIGTAAGGGVGIKERNGDGQLISGSGKIQLYFAAGDIFPGWHPSSVILTIPSTTPPPSTPIPSTSPPSALLGDLNGDGHVDIQDLNQLLVNFTNIFDYNLVVANFGKPSTSAPSPTPIITNLPTITSIIGWADRISCDAPDTAGWTTDNRNHSQKLSVKLEVFPTGDPANKIIRGGITANQYRADLITAGVCPDGICAYGGLKIGSLPLLFLNKQLQANVYGYTSDGQNLLSGSKLIGPCNNLIPNAPTVVSTQIYGWVDGANCSTFAGWVKDQRNLANKVTVRADAYPVGDPANTYTVTVTANQYRADLITAGVCPDGRCAYSAAWGNFPASFAGKKINFTVWGFGTDGVVNTVQFGAAPKEIGPCN